MRKKREDHSSIIKLTQTYVSIENRLRQIIFEPSVITLDAQKTLLDGTLKSAQKTLQKVNKGFTEKDLKVAYKEGKDNADKYMSQATKNAFKPLQGNRLDSNTFKSNKYSRIRHGAFIDLNTGLTSAINYLSSEIKQTLRTLDDKNRNLWEFTNAIKDKLKDSGILEVKYKNGRSINLASYAKTLSRSCRIETANIGSFMRAAELGTDLVKCIGQSPTCELCATFRNRMFSVSGVDKRFPALFETALSYGYALIHPNCRCEFVPYFEELESKEQVEKDIAFSNREFKDSRTKEERDSYAEWQAGNRQLWAEQAEYENLQKSLGKDMPYKDLGSFRRARRHYEEVKKDTSIDNSVSLRYNKYAALKRHHRTITSIKSKGVAKGYTSEYIKKMEDTYQEFKSNGIEMTDHSINRFLGQKAGRGKQPFTKDDVITACKSQANFKQENGREIHYYNGVAVVIKSDTGEIITLNYYEKENAKWEKL